MGSKFEIFGEFLVDEPGPGNGRVQSLVSQDLGLAGLNSSKFGIF